MGTHDLSHGALFQRQHNRGDVQTSLHLASPIVHMRLTMPPFVEATMVYWLEAAIH
jgi:hypothetical protein